MRLIESSRRCSFSSCNFRTSSTSVVFNGLSDFDFLSSLIATANFASNTTSGSSNSKFSTACFSVATVSTSVIGAISLTATIFSASITGVSTIGVGIISATLISDVAEIGCSRLMYVFSLRTSTLIVFVAEPGTLLCFNSLTLRRFKTTRLGEFSASVP